MEPILNFAQLTAHLKKLNHRKRIAVVCANDPNTEYAISRALEEGIAEFLMIGDSTILKKYPTLKQYPEYVKTIHIENPDEAAREAVRIVREGGADILMKGIINTDNLLHAILDKEKGLLPKGKILTHLAVMEIPTYHKLLFFSDAAGSAHQSPADRDPTHCPPEKIGTAYSESPRKQGFTKGPEALLHRSSWTRLHRTHRA